MAEQDHTTRAWAWYHWSLFRTYRVYQARISDGVGTIDWTTLDPPAKVYLLPHRYTIATCGEALLTDPDYCVLFEPPPLRDSRFDGPATLSSISGPDFDPYGDDYFPDLIPLTGWWTEVLRLVRSVRWFWKGRRNNHPELRWQLLLASMRPSYLQRHGLELPTREVN